MLDYLQDHQKLATVISISVAAAVVLFLVMLSSGNTPPPASNSEYQSVISHSQDGPVDLSSQGAVVSGDAAGTEGQGIRQAVLPGLVAEETAGGWTIDPPVFCDIGGDGNEEALVVVHGEGEINPLDWRLYGMKNGEVTLLKERTNVAQGEIAVQGPMLVETEGIYNTGDQACCPTSRIRNIYVWKDGSLVKDRTESTPPFTAAP